MLNRILGRTKAKDLTSEEIQQIAGAGCQTVYLNTWICTDYVWQGGSDETCYGTWKAYPDPYQSCN
jgi:hypothetical protein